MNSVSAQPDRLPPNHQLVYEVVRAQPPGVHATVGDIFAIARERHRRIGYSTVYRALNRLCDLGLVAEVQTPGRGPALYEPARPRHAHFHCDSCGSVHDVDYTLPAAMLDEIARRCGGAISGASLALHGICARCAASPEHADGGA